MDNLIPAYYTEFGRGITRFQAIPFYIDALKPVHRRILLGAHEVANKSFTKSAKVVGHVIANYHFHGDAAVYQTMVLMVQQGYLIGQGNWGAPGVIEDSPAAAYRYTECKLAPWVEELAFKYIKYVDWDAYESHAVEPLYLPAPIPIGLIGNGVIEGIAFHTTYIPKYSAKTLFDRLFYLIDKKKRRNDWNYQCEPGCKVVDGDSEALFSKGEGQITITSTLEIDNKSRSIDVIGRPYKKSYNKLFEFLDKNNIQMKDLSDSIFRMRLAFSATNWNKINKNMETFLKGLVDKYLKKTHNFKCIFCDENGTVDIYPLDSIIMNSYEYWKKAKLNKLHSDYKKEIQALIDALIISEIRKILSKKKNINSIQSIVTELKTPFQIKLPIVDGVSNEAIEVTEEMVVDVCNRYNIKRLIEVDLNINDIISSANELYNQIQHIDDVALEEAVSLSKLFK